MDIKLFTDKSVPGMISVTAETTFKDKIYASAKPRIICGELTPEVEKEIKEEFKEAVTLQATRNAWGDKSLDSVIINETTNGIVATHCVTDPVTELLKRINLKLHEFKYKHRGTQPNVLLMHPDSFSLMIHQMHIFHFEKVMSSKEKVRMYGMEIITSHDLAPGEVKVLME